MESQGKTEETMKQSLDKNSKEGGENWTCPLCNNVNWPKRTVCNNSMCRAPRNTSNRGGEQPDSPEGNWLCYIAGCGNVNWPSRTICNRRSCHAPKYVGAFDTKTIQMLEESNAPPGTWVCPHCQNFNWPKRTVCNRGCGTQRPQMGPISGGNIPLLQQQHGMNRGMDVSSHMGFQPYGGNAMGFPSASGGSGQGNSNNPPGSWVCPQCQNVNWPHRDVCNGKGCDVHRPENNGMEFPMSGGMSGGMSGMSSFAHNNNMSFPSSSFSNMGTFSSPTSSFGPKNPQGSWECSKCSNINWPNRDFCNSKNCSNPRPLTQNSEPMSSRPTAPHPVGSWICPTCANVNWPNREVCNMSNCETTKPVEVSTIV